MNSFASEDWLAANQMYLVSALDRVRQALKRYISLRGKSEPELSSPPQAQTNLIGSEAGRASEGEKPLPAPPALQTLCAVFGLSPFERDLLLLCAGRELDGSFGALCASAQGDARRESPTFSLALAALPEAHWGALSPSAPLRRWHLIELGSGEVVTAAPLRIDERVLHFLAGIDHFDHRLQCLVQPVTIKGALPLSQHGLARRIADTWIGAPPERPRPIIHLRDGDADDRRAVAVEACALVGLELHSLCWADIPSSAAERDLLARLWQREAIFSRSGLFLDTDDGEPESGHKVTPFLERVGGFVVVSRRDAITLSQRSVIRFDVAKPNASEQRALWEETLGPVAAQLNGQLGRLLTQFNFSAGNIREAGAELCQSPGEADVPAIGKRLWKICCARTRPRLDDLAQRLRPAAGWSDLVLPEDQRKILGEIAAQVRQRYKVYETWGFVARGDRGLGISALFAGPSGTGKTMAAELLAAQLELDLYRIDLSAVVSKYIGETEKNLRRIFDAAEDSGVILLFDEADALFGKRSEVKDSHDRYANVEISYLLQRMEAYRGLAILTTNMKTALDTAFLRRIRFVVRFPFPDAAQRAEIWRHIFPAGTPTAALDVAKLALLNVPGGNIRNIALNAAFLAADEGQPVSMNHVFRATRTEYSKLEKSLTDSEIKGWL